MWKNVIETLKEVWDADLIILFGKISPISAQKKENWNWLLMALIVCLAEKQGKANTIKCVLCNLNSVGYKKGLKLVS